MTLAAAAADPLAPWGPHLLIGGLIALFACARVLVALLVRQESWLGARALAYFAPIAATALVAMFLGRPDVAMAVVFGTSVAAMTTVVGYIALAGPVGAGSPRARRIWAFQLAAALLVLVAGFKGTLTWRDAVALLIQGMLLLTLWNDRAADDRPTGEALDDALSPPPAVPAGNPLNYASADAGALSHPWTARRVLLLTVELTLTTVLLWLGAWAVTHGTTRTGPALRGLAPIALAGSAVSVGLAMPMMYGAWRLAANHRGWAPVTTQVLVVLLNLCALLPVLIMIPYAAAHVPGLSRWAGDALFWHEGLPKVLVFPAALWRVDNVVLVVMGVFLLPVSLGKWALGREEGAVLIAGYFFYLTTTIASGYAGGVPR
jgi:Ca2+/Na+ antiporter